MPRLTLDEVSLPGQHARPAHIAAMGQRLAAAGPRTRGRVSQRYNPLAEIDEDIVPPAMPQPPSRTPDLVADRSHAVMRDITPILPPSPRRRLVTTIGRAAALSVMASAGFGLVLVVQSPRWSAGQHLVPTKQAGVAIGKSEPQSSPKLPEPAKSPQLAAGDSGKNVASEPAQPATSPPVPPAVSPPVLPAALTPKAAPAAPVSVPHAATAPRPLHVRLAVAHRPRLEALQPVHVAARHEAQRPAPLVHYDLPRWLTEARTTPPRPIIMSPPPHDLQAPETQLASTVPRPLLPPLPRPRLIYASAGYAPPNPVIYRAPYPYGYDQPQPYRP